MSRRACVLLALIALVLGAAVQASGADAPAGGTAPPTGDEVSIYADRLERRTGERIIVGEGAVEIRHGDLHLAADRVVYHEDTKDAVADGHVLLDSGTDRLQGEHLEINLETRIGFVEHGQGFVQTYYFTGERIEKRGPDRYFIRNGSFTTCEGALPDWSFHTTSTSVTVDEYLHAWNPTLRVKRLPVLYLPYAIFPIKRERATGLLVPEIQYTGLDGFVIRNQFYWAPRDDFDATIGVDYLGATGYGVVGEMRYLLAPLTHGELDAYFVRKSETGDERWLVTSRHSHELPLGVHGEAELFFQSDRQFIGNYGQTLEERSSERNTSSFYLNRSWSAYDFALSGRYEESLITEKRTTLTRLPELTVNRTSTRLFGTDLFLKVGASGVALKRTDEEKDSSTTRLHLGPELTWPLSLGGVVSLIPATGYALTWYSEGRDGSRETRALPYYRLGLEGPRVYRVFELSEGARFARLKHLIEPRISYVFTPTVDQSNIPQFDSIDLIAPANRLEYSITNTLYGKDQDRASVAPLTPFTPLTPLAEEPQLAPVAGQAAVPGEAPPAGEASGAGAETGTPPIPVPAGATQDLFYFKVSQTYTFDETETEAGHPFSPVEWEARTRPLRSLEIWWKGNVDVYGKGVGYQNLSVTWRPWDVATIRGEWRTARDSSQDFLDLGANFDFKSISLDGRSRYNLGEKTFVENRIGVKYVSQCWDLSLGYVRWPSDYQYMITLSLKGIGTIVKF